MAREAHAHNCPSRKAVYDGSRPIRGGIPIVFPQFGLGPITARQHGFARIQTWKVTKTAPHEVQCTLCHNEATLAEWPFLFELVYTITLAEGHRLQCDLVVTNVSPAGATFDFSMLFHTYFDVSPPGDPAKARSEGVTTLTIEGLHALPYSDKLAQGRESREERLLVTVDGEVDRTYMGVSRPVFLKTHAGRIKIEGSPTLTDAVVWNPWVEKAKAMADFADDEYQSMVCIELGHVSHNVTLPPLQSWHARQTLSVVD